MREILEKCRTWTEIIAEEEGFSPTLMGLCAVGAAKVCHELQKRKYPARIAYNRNHVFVLLKDKLIDITATQFVGYPDIFITQFPAREWWYGLDRLFMNWRQLVRQQQIDDWDRNQMYSSYLS